MKDVNESSNATSSSFGRSVFYFSLIAISVIFFEVFIIIFSSPAPESSTYFNRLLFAIELFFAVVVIGILCIVIRILPLLRTKKERKNDANSSSNVEVHVLRLEVKDLKMALEELRKERSRNKATTNSYLYAEIVEIKKRFAEITEIKKEFADVVEIRNELDKLKKDQSRPVPILPRISVAPPPPPPPLPANLLCRKPVEIRVVRNAPRKNNAILSSAKKIDMSEVLKDIGKVTLRKINRSPGGTPIRPPQPRTNGQRVFRDRCNNLRKVSPTKASEAPFVGSLDL